MWEILILDDDKNVNNVHKPKKVAKTGTFIDRINEKLLSVQNIKTAEKVIFYRLLSTMTNAWMSVLKSIQVLERQEKNPAFKKMLWEFIYELKEGQTLSYCLAKYPWSFEEAEIWVISSWEKTGQLNQTLIDLSNQIEKVESISGKLKSAMMYPFFIIVVVFWVVWVMMVAVVPKLLEIFDSKEDLPASTQVLIFVSDMFRDYWFLMIILIIVSVLFLSIWKKTPDWRYLWDAFILKLPIFWEINKKLTLSKFSRVFSWLLSSGVSVVECLNITASAVWNEVYKQRLLLLSEDVKQWIKIWESLDWDKYFPDMMVQMIQIWEQTAKLDQTILKVADFYDEQVDNTIWILNKLLEPFILVFLAVVVWFIAISIMQPIMWLADTISQK